MYKRVYSQLNDNTAELYFFDRRNRIIIAGNAIKEKSDTVDFIEGMLDYCENKMQGISELWGYNENDIIVNKGFDDDDKSIVDYSFKLTRNRTTRNSDSVLELSVIFLQEMRNLTSIGKHPINITISLFPKGDGWQKIKNPPAPKKLDSSQDIPDNRLIRIVGNYLIKAERILHES
jgi:hypothetical protein